MDEAAIMEAAEVAVDGFIFVWPMAFHTEDGVGDGIIMDGVYGVDVRITWELVVPARRSGTRMIWLADGIGEVDRRIGCLFGFHATSINWLFNYKKYSLIQTTVPSLICPGTGVEWLVGKLLGALTMTDIYSIASSFRECKTTEGTLYLNLHLFQPESHNNQGLVGYKLSSTRQMVSCEHTLASLQQDLSYMQELDVELFQGSSYVWNGWCH